MPQADNPALPLLSAVLRRGKNTDCVTVMHPATVRNECAILAEQYEQAWQAERASWQAREERVRAVVERLRCFLPPTPPTCTCKRCEGIRELANEIEAALSDPAPPTKSICKWCSSEDPANCSVHGHCYCDELEGSVVCGYCVNKH